MNYTFRFPEMTLGYAVLALPLYVAVVIARLVLFPEILSEASVTALILPLMGGAVLVFIPAVSPVLGTVLLFLAGRSEFAPLWTGITDVFFLLILGFLSIMVRNLLFPSDKGRRVFINVHPVLIGVFLFSILYGLQFITSQHTAYGTEKVIRTSVFALILTVITAQVISRKDSRKQFAIMYLLAVGAMSGLAVALAIAEHGLLGIQRISPIGGGPITLGRFTGFAALICMAYYLRNGRKRSLLGLAWFMGITLLNGSRGPLFALLLAVVVLLIPSLVAPSVRGRAWKLAAFLIASVVAFVAAFLLAVSAGAPFARRYVILFTSEGGGSSVSARLDWILETREMLERAPFWGSGVASWPILKGWASQSGYPHNIFSELLIENGTFATAIFLMILLTALVLAARSLVLARDSSEYSDGAIGAGLLVFSLIGAQVSGDLFDNRYIWISMGWLAAVNASQHYMNKRHGDVTSCLKQVNPDGGSRALLQNNWG